MAIEMSDQANRYVRLWRIVIVDFLGRSESELDELVRHYRDGLADECDQTMFYHEAPEYYVAHKLVPEGLRESMGVSADWSRLCWSLYPIVGRFDRECGLAPECFDALRRELNRAIASWVIENQRERR